MQRPADVLLFTCLIVSSLSTVHAQESPTTVSRVRDLKTLVVATDAKSDSVILVPPATSVSVNLKSGKKSADADAVDLPNWLTKQAALNGLQSTDLRPWHIVVTYDQFDEDGDNVHSGVYEEYWAGRKSTNASTRATTLIKRTMLPTRACFVMETNSGPTAHSYRFGQRYLPRSPMLIRFKVFMEEMWSALLAATNFSAF